MSACVPLDAEQITRIVQRAVALVGLPAVHYGSHSLRAGLITEAAEEGASELQIASQSGHADMAVLRRYVRKRDPFRSNPCSLLDV
jgi:integrase